MMTRKRSQKSKDNTLNKSASYASSSDDNIFDFMDGNATKAIKRNKENLKPPKKVEEEAKQNESFKSSKGMSTRRRNKK